MEQLKHYLEIALKRGVTDAIVVETAKVFTDAWVKMRCQFGCRMYGKSLCCPPHAPAPEEMRKVLDSYTYGILLHRHFAKDFALANDFNGFSDFNDIVLSLEHAIFFDGYYKAWSVGCGPCKKCKECNIAATCLHANQARPSMEACGIDVFRTAMEYGLPIKTLKDRSEEIDTYGLILVE